MADLDHINPSVPLRRIGPDPQRQAPQREPQRRKRPPDGLTDDQGERRDDDPPLIDDFA